MEERLYDLIFICRPATPEEEINKIVSTLEHSAVEHGGKVEKTEKWGTRRLAYRVSKHREGFFVYMVLKSSQSDIIKELERRLKVSDAVIKYQTVRLDEDRAPSRAPRQPPSAQAGSDAGSATAGSARGRTDRSELMGAGSTWSLPRGRCGLYLEPA
jgi:small subunit ribosomal protein S6